MSDKVNDGGPAFPKNVTLRYLGGNCPVQAEGTVDGKPFYFRARGNEWRMNIGGEDEAVIITPEWTYAENYGAEPFAAGWMSEAEAAAFMNEAFTLYADAMLKARGGE